MQDLRAQMPQNETGKKVANYIYYYEHMVGKGNFAKVYRALHLLTKETVAIKAISLDELKSKRLEALVFEEIKILQLMNHPHVLRFHQALLSDRNCYIVTELCNGGNLEERIKRAPITNSEIATIILQIIQGLRYLRSMDVVHRDLKPANIFIHSGQIKIADFGLAKLYKQRFHDLDIGSPQYMSPEGVFLNVYSDKTDVWSLGIIVYELVHGRPPFSFCKDQQEFRYCLGRPLPESMVKKDMNACFRQLMNVMMEIDEKKRPNINQILQMPAIQALHEMAKSGKGEGKRKFSFYQPLVNTGVFQKKKEQASLNTKMPSNTQLNKSVQASKTSLKLNNTLIAKTSQFVPPKPQPLRMSSNRQSIKTIPNFSPTKSMEGSLLLWQGKTSNRTNQTKESQEQHRYIRTQTERSFYKPY